MSDEVLVKVDNVSKKFCRNLKKSLWYGLQDLGTELIGKKYDHELRPNEFWSLKDISFELKRGQCLGLIGRNGAGKSTLLRVLNGLIKPDRGSVTLKGKVAGLIALGAGFNPILTGRENIYINGSMLGYTKKQIDAKFDEIVAFSEIEEFIDSPVQTYSSGMNVRLGFSAAVFLTEPDVLLLDEVLAVGDIGFMLKCLNKIQELIQSSAVIFVSHSMQHIFRFCTGVLVLNQGQVINDNQEIGAGIMNYLNLFPTVKSANLSGQIKLNKVELIGEKVFKDEQIEDKIVHYGSDVSLSIDLSCQPDIKPFEVRVSIDNFYTMSPVIQFECVDEEGKLILFDSNIKQIILDLGNVNLTCGKYSIGISIVEPKPLKRLAKFSNLAPFQIVGIQKDWAFIKQQAPTHFVSQTASL